MIWLLVVAAAIVGSEVGRELQKCLAYRPPVAVAVGAMQTLAGICLVPGGSYRMALGFCLILCGCLPLGMGLSQFWGRWRQARRRKAKQSAA
jgi:hypothetical protein